MDITKCTRTAREVLSIHDLRIYNRASHIPQDTSYKWGLKGRGDMGEY